MITFTSICGHIPGSQASADKSSPNDSEVIGIGSVLIIGLVSGDNYFTVMEGYASG